MLEAQREDKQLAPIMQALQDDALGGDANADEQQPRLVRLFGDAFHLASDGLLLFQPSLTGQRRSPAPRLVVPACHRQQVFDLYHAHAQSGAHYGYDRMLHSMRPRFFWLNMARDVKNMCQACGICSQRSHGAGGTQARTVQERPVEPFERMVVDVLGPLRPTQHGNRYLIIFVDVASRWVIPVPTHSFDAEATARILIHHVWCEYGTLPKVLLSDQGSNFVSEVMQHVYKMLGIEKVEGTAYNATTQGMVERYNGTFATAMSKYVCIHHNNWDVLTPLVAAAYKCSQHSRNGCSPFTYLFGGTLPRLPADLPFEDAGDVVARQQFPTVDAAWKAIRAWRTFVTDLAKDKQQRQYDTMGAVKQPRKLAFAAGDLVMINRNRAKKGQSRKFVLPWRGPFSILRKTDRPGEYILATAAADKAEYPEIRREELRWNARNMKKYTQPSIPAESQKSFAKNEDRSNQVAGDHGDRKCRPPAATSAPRGKKGTNQAPDAPEPPNEVTPRLRSVEVQVGDLVSYMAPRDELVRGRVLKRSRSKKPTLTILFEDLSMEVKPLRPHKFVTAEDKLQAAGQWCSAELPLIRTNIADAVGHYGTANCRSVESNSKVAPHYQAAMPDGRTVYYPVALAAKWPWSKTKLQD